MKNLSQAEGQTFRQDLLELMISREVKNFVDNEGDYVNEPDDYIEELYATLCDPSFNHRISQQHFSKTELSPTA